MAHPSDDDFWDDARIVSAVAVHLPAAAFLVGLLGVVVGLALAILAPVPASGGWW